MQFQLCIVHHPSCKRAHRLHTSYITHHAPCTNSLQGQPAICLFDLDQLRILADLQHLVVRPLLGSHGVRCPLPPLRGRRREPLGLLCSLYALFALLFCLLCCGELPSLVDSRLLQSISCGNLGNLSQIFLGMHRHVRCTLKWQSKGKARPPRVTFLL